VQVEGGLIGVNTGAPNTLVAEALAAGRIPELAAYPSRRREVRYGEASRIDLLLEGGDRPSCYVEVKNVHLKRDGWAEFPDCVTLRGAKHMGELARMVEAGFRAVVLYVIQRTDCTQFRIAGDLDPGYHRALDAARKAGVEVLCYSCDISFEGVEIAGSIPFTP
jgi:sugar fermentation stimulation protein A